MVIALLVAGFSLWRARYAVKVEPMLDAGFRGEGGGVVTADGRAWIWGEAVPMVFGRTNPVPPRHRARRLEGIDRVVQIAVGERMLLALRQDGTVWSTGTNAWGLLGTPAIARNASTRPDVWHAVAGLKDVQSLSLGRNVAYAVLKDGSVWGWGKAAVGALGAGFRGEFSSVPVRIAGLWQVRRIVAGGWDNDSAVNYLLKDDGSLWAWGSYYHLGLPWKPDEPGWKEQHTIDAALPVPGIGRVAALAPHTHSASIGGLMVVALVDGSVVNFAGINSGVCMDANRQGLPMPLTVPGMKGIVSVASMISQVFAVDREGALWRWADRSIESTTSGSLGCMATAERLLPPGSARQVSGSQLSAMVLRQDGSVQVWGKDAPNNNARDRYSDVYRTWSQRLTIEWGR